MGKPGEGNNGAPVWGLPAEAIRARLAIDSPSDDELEQLLRSNGVLTPKQAERARRVAGRLKVVRWFGDVLVELGYCDPQTLQQSLEQAKLPLPLGVHLVSVGLLSVEQFQRAGAELGASALSAGVLGNWLQDQGLMGPERRLAVQASRLGIPLLGPRHRPRVLSEFEGHAGDSWVLVQGLAGPVIAVTELADLEARTELLEALGETLTFALTTRDWIAARRLGLSASEARPEGHPAEWLLKTARRLKASDVLLDTARDGTQVWFRIHGVTVRRPNLSLEHVASVLAWFERSSADHATHGIRVLRLAGLHGPCLRITLSATQVSGGGFEDFDMPADTRNIVCESLLTPSAGVVLVAGPRLGEIDRVLGCAVRESLTFHPRTLSVGPTTIDGVVSLERRTENVAESIRQAVLLGPEALLVGELSDAATARAAFWAAARGIKIYASLVAEGSLDVFARLRALAVEPAELALQLVGALSVRLVRELCTACREVDPEGSRSQLLRRLQVPLDYFGSASIYRAGGCEACGLSGFHGEVGVFESLVLDERLRACLLASPGLDTLWGVLVGRQGPSLLEAALRRVAIGQTGLGEIARALPRRTPWERGATGLESLDATDASARETDADTCWTWRFNPGAKGTSASPPLNNSSDSAVLGASEPDLDLKRKTLLSFVDPGRP